MPNHFSWRPINTLGDADAGIPILSLRDGRDAERVHFVLFNDQERHNLAEFLERAEIRRGLLVVRAKQTAWYDRFWGRMAIVVGALAATADFILAVKAAFGR